MSPYKYKSDSQYQDIIDIDNNCGEIWRSGVKDHDLHKKILRCCMKCLLENCTTYGLYIWCLVRDRTSKFIDGMPLSPLPLKIIFISLVISKVRNS